MAQALFADHPIEEYLRESGELPEVLLPGGIYEFVKEPAPEDYGNPIENAILRSFINCLSMTSDAFCHYVSLDKPSQSQQFAERFKYLIISSSLLSTSLPSSPSIYVAAIAPGHYPPVSSASSQSPMSLSSTIDIFIPMPSQVFTFIILCLIPIFLALGYYVIILLALLIARFLATDQAPREETWSLTLETLESLVQSNNSWEGVINESLKLLENEEHSPISSQHSFHQTFFDTLRAVQTQCDDVRHLLAAISIPETIAQLSPMYAPPSPSRLEPQFGFSIPNRRPLSLAATSDLPQLSSSTEHSHGRLRTTSQPSYFNKRATWNAPYYSSVYPSDGSKRGSTSLTVDGSRMELPGINYSASAPATPFVNNQDDLPFYGEGDEPFGVTALNIRRRKRIPSFSPPVRNSLTGLVGSRFTSLMSSFSREKSDPRMAIQTTLAARRHTCSHLLALRFPGSNPETSTPTTEYVDSPDEGYWEDVRTIIGLLTNVLQNATNKLNGLLEQHHQSDKVDDSLVESLVSKRESSTSSNSFIHPTNSESVSFAPLPSQFSRFAAHIDAISNALEEARSNLRQCVETLAEDGDDSTSFTLGEPSPKTVSTTKSGAMHAYDELRQTLGYALRECERGREPLRSLLGEERKSITEQIAEKASGSLTKVVETETEHHDEQFGSDDSDKTLYNIEDQSFDFRDEDQKVDYDATGHIHYLPPPGVEQVFEAESVPLSFNRQRSKLTREERIALVKAQRKEGIKDSINIPNKHGMGLGLGPGDEVVQELKDVIWKVGEQRRQMSLSRIST